MKKGLSTSLQLSALLAGSLLCSSVAYAEEQQSVYWKLNSGVSLLNKTDVSYPGLGSGQLKAKTGFAINYSVGFRINPIFAVELESGYTRNSWESVDGIAVTGSGSQVPILANLVLSPKLSESISGDLGVGLGVSINTADIGIAGIGSTSSETKTTLMGQFRAGLNFKLSENVSADLGYRFRLVDGPKFSSQISTNTIFGHVISAGLTVSF
jgi:opacity protein-like surface antigen